MRHTRSLRHRRHPFAFPNGYPEPLPAIRSTFGIIPASVGTARNWFRPAHSVARPPPWNARRRKLERALGGRGSSLAERPMRRDWHSGPSGACPPKLSCVGRSLDRSCIPVGHRAARTCSPTFSGGRYGKTSAHFSWASLVASMMEPRSSSRRVALL